MTPNENLRRQEWLLTRMAQYAREGGGRSQLARQKLSELRASLYDDIANTGQQPRWSRYPLTAKYYGKGRNQS